MSHSGQKGFTLLELLVALAIFALLAVMAYTGLRSVLDAEHETAARAQRLAALQRAVSILSADMGQIVQRGIRDEFGDLRPPLLGSPDGKPMLEFTRGGRVVLAGQPGSSLQRIAYSAEAGTLTRWAWPVLDRTQESKPYHADLLEGVDRMAVRFLGADGQWRDDWPPPANGNEVKQADPLPRAVEVTLELDEWGAIRRLFALPPGDAG